MTTKQVRRIAEDISTDLIEGEVYHLILGYRKLRDHFDEVSNINSNDASPLLNILADTLCKTDEALTEAIITQLDFLGYDVVKRDSNKN